MYRLVYQVVRWIKVAQCHLLKAGRAVLRIHGIDAGPGEDQAITGTTVRMMLKMNFPLREILKFFITKGADINLGNSSH